MKEVQALPDARRWLASLQATNQGWDAFAGGKLIAKPKTDLILGAYAGAPWSAWKDPSYGVRLAWEF